MNKAILVFAVSLAISLSLSFSFPTFADSSCPQVSKAQISDLFVQWNKSLQTGKSAEVAENYADEGILLPTVSNQVRHDHLEIENYFEHFLALKPIGHLDEQNIRIYCDVAINSGIYTFDVVKDGKPTQVQARYTFVYRQIDDRWLIVEHHSSAMPEKAK